MTDRRKNVSRSQASEVKPQGQVQTTEKAAKASTREERRESATMKSTNKPAAQRTSKAPSSMTRLRNNKVGRFAYDAYYELRYKVTWPTFEEARNMTIMVVIISAVLGALLSLVDFGLYHLFILVIGGK